jgi:hypothetical protein
LPNLGIALGIDRRLLAGRSDKVQRLVYSVVHSFSSGVQDDCCCTTQAANCATAAANLAFITAAAAADKALHSAYLSL